LQLVEIISKEQPVQLSRLCRLSGLKKTTVSRLTGTLRVAGIIQQDPKNKTLSLTIRVIELGSRVLNKLHVRRLGRPPIEEFVTKNGMSVLLSVLDRNEIIYIDKVTAHEPYRINMTVGDRAPAYCTGSGKALLAFIDAGLRREILRESYLTRLTERTITDIEELETELAATRKRGYAIDFEERMAGIVSVGAPIFGPKNSVLAAISVPRLKTTLPDGGLEWLGQKITVLAQNISRLAGCEEHFIYQVMDTSS
jgi:IclR family transcriptional regulator, KDG regulon repressor